MINDGDFKESVEEIINNPDAYTKDEIYTAFLEMTEDAFCIMTETDNHPTTPNP